MQPDIAPTSLSLNMLARLNRTHSKAAIAIFTGPPGISKTTMINTFAAENAGCVARCKMPGKNVSAPAAIKQMLRAISALVHGHPDRHVQTESTRLAYQIKSEMQSWRNARREVVDDPRLTVVFDEGQTLSRNAVEALRFWNDADGQDEVFPIGLIFVGNHELSLRVDDKGQSTISAAVASRALYSIEYGNDALSEADFTMVMAARGVADPAAAAAVNHYFRHTRDRRDLRALLRLIAELEDEAAGEPITLATVRNVIT